MKLLLSTKFSDAQCAFKAITREAVQKSGFRNFDLPVTWIDDPDSRAIIIKTAWEDVKGLWRVRRGFREGKYSHLKRIALASPEQYSSRIRSEMLESCGE